MKNKIRKFFGVAVMIAAVTAGTLNGYAGTTNDVTFEGVNVGDNSIVEPCVSCVSPDIKTKYGQGNITEIGSIKLEDGSYIVVIKIKPDKTMIDPSLLVNGISRRTTETVIDVY